MKTGKKIAKYPENIWLKGVIAVSGKTVTELAEAIGYRRSLVSDVVNGHYKGTKVIPLLKKELGISDNASSEASSPVDQDNLNK